MRRRSQYRRRSAGAADDAKQRPDPAAQLIAPDYWQPELTELLAQTRQWGVRCDSGSLERLGLYCSELARWSARVNLVSRREIGQLVSKHVAASLGVFLVEDHREGEKWLDIGTGGGLPGMIVKLCRLKLPIVLVESSRKKTVFLEEIRDKLQLADVAVVWSRVEEYGNDAFSVMLMRAVAPLSASFPLIDALAGSGTRLLTYKGPAWEKELASAKPTMQRLGWRFVSMTQVPWTTSRILKFTKS